MKTVTDAIIDAAAGIILGKNQQIRLALACLLARGHLLIEDVPGVGKTTLAHTLATVLGLSYQRIQFTSDLLPADILGVSVFDRDSGSFRFHPGPIFSQLILADEVNRATPKAQSALLEAMEEQQVTQEGETRPLPTPFFVIATQNPSNQIGTFPLPESQLDRFMMCLSLGYPETGAERTLLKGEDRRDLLQGLAAVIDTGQLVELQQQVARVTVSDPLIDYLQMLVAHSRNSGDFHAGLSPRAALSIKHAAQAWALLAGREYAIPEDIQAVLPAVVAHRLSRTTDKVAAQDADPGRVLIERVAIP